MKHTKGPWHFIKEHNKRTIYQAGTKSPRIGFAHTDANARIMAAAPEMLDALLLVRDRDTDDPNSYDDAFEKVLEAIEKAGGNNA